MVAVIEQGGWSVGVCIAYRSFRLERMSVALYTEPPSCLVAESSTNGKINPGTQE